MANKTKELELLIKAIFTLLCFHMKTEQSLSGLALRSHCSAAKTELFENANETHKFENGAF